MIGARWGLPVVGLVHLCAEAGRSQHSEVCQKAGKRCRGLSFGSLLEENDGSAAVAVTTRWTGAFWLDAGARHAIVGRRGEEEEDDHGAATPLTLMLGVALIILPVMVLILTVPIWEQRTVDAQDAARAAARAMVAASTAASGLVAAKQAVDEVLQGDGVPPAQVSVTFAGEDIPGGSVTVSVTVVIPAGRVPGLGAIGDLHYTARSTEHVDTYEDSTT